jgi:hypothetical protein
MAFFAVSPTDWEQARADLTGGSAWPTGLAVVDLRYHQDRALGPHGKFPTRSKLAREWGWSKSKVSRLLADVATWSDPLKLEEWTAWYAANIARGPKADRQRTKSEPGPDQDRTERPTENHDNPGKVDQARTDTEPEPNQDRTESDHRRVGPPSTLHLSPFTVSVGLAPEPKPPTDAERLRVVYAEERKRLIPSARVRGGWPSTWGVSARIKEHGFEAMARMIRWAHRSTHSRAKWLRGEHPDASEALGQTLFRRSKCAEYVDLSADWHEGSDRPTTTTKNRDPWRALLALPSFANPQRRNPPVRGQRVVWPLVQLDSAPTDADRQEHRRRHRALVAAGGWVAWCNLSHPLDRQRFERAFRAAYDAEGVR